MDLSEHPVVPAILEWRMSEIAVRELRFVVQKAERLLAALANGQDELGHDAPHAAQVLSAAVDIAKHTLGDSLIDQPAALIQECELLREDSQRLNVLEEMRQAGDLELIGEAVVAWKALRDGGELDASHTTLREAADAEIQRRQRTNNG
jgi:hypothetical protein